MIKCCRLSKAVDRCVIDGSNLWNAKLWNAVGQTSSFLFGSNPRSTKGNHCNKSHRYDSIDCFFTSIERDRGQIYFDRNRLMSKLVPCVWIECKFCSMEHRTRHLDTNQVSINFKIYSTFLTPNSYRRNCIDVGITSLRSNWPLVRIDRTLSRFNLSRWILIERKFPPNNAS